MIKKTSIHGFLVSYEDKENYINYAITHLRDDLQPDEARVFFDQAKLKGSAQFEDDEDHQFTILYRNGAYTILSRK